MNSSSVVSVLLCSVPVTGHVTPLLSIARSLVADGMTVRFLTGARFADAVRGTGAEFLALPPEADYDDRRLNERFPERVGKTGIAQIRFDIRNIFLRPMEGQIQAIREAMVAQPVDVLLAEPGFVGAAGIALAPRSSRPDVFALCLVPMMLPSRDTAPSGLGMRPMRGPLGPVRNRLLHFLIERLVLGSVLRAASADFRRFAGYPLPGTLFGAAGEADRFLQFTVPGFEYPRRDLPANVRFVGPMFGAARPDSELPDWWADLDGRTVVHVTQGTFANDDFGELIVPTIRGLENEDVLVVVSTGGRSPERLLEDLGGRLPGNVRVADFLPYDALLPRTAVMVTNGGYGGVHYALRYGVPLVVSGKTEDKAEVGARVAWSGVGVDLRAQRPKPEAVARAVRRVLADPSYRSASERIGREIAASGGVAEVVGMVRQAALDRL